MPILNIALNKNVWLFRMKWPYSINAGPFTTVLYTESEPHVYVSVLVGRQIIFIFIAAGLPLAPWTASCRGWAKQGWLQIWRRNLAGTKRRARPGQTAEARTRTRWLSRSSRTRLRYMDYAMPPTHRTIPYAGRWKHDTRLLHSLH